MNHQSIAPAIACFFFLLFSPFLKAQTPAPGGVDGLGMWYRPADDTLLIGNRHTFDLLAFEDSLQRGLPREITSTTFFLVLRPAFEQASGKEFLQMGGLKLYDDKLVHHGVTTPLDFTDGEPKILTVRSQRVPRYGNRYFPPVRLLDPSLFDLAEMVYYPGLKDHDEIQKVHSYLALKYSITITENTIPTRRNYLKKDSTMYWNTLTDGLFAEQVIGIGNSEDEDFMQTQTATNTADFMLVALDTAKPLGEMPGILVHEDAFIVFSRRSPIQAAGSHCAGENPAVNPLWDWKFKLHDWLSAATELVIQVERPRGNLSDSLALFDGDERVYLKHTWVDSTLVEYRIPFDTLLGDRHYFFVPPQSTTCDSIETALSENGELSVVWPGGEDWILETRNMEDGLLVSEDIRGESAFRQLGQGQHLVTIRDGEGEERKTEVYYVNDNPAKRQQETTGRTLPRIDVFPNPAGVHTNVHIRVEGLEAVPTRMLITDSDGRIMKEEEIPSGQAGTFSRQSTFQVSGVYYINIVQGKRLYSRKVVVMR